MSGNNIQLTLFPHPMCEQIECFLLRQAIAFGAGFPFDEIGVLEEFEKTLLVGIKHSKDGLQLELLISVPFPCDWNLSMSSELAGVMVLFEDRSHVFSVIRNTKSTSEKLRIKLSMNSIFQLIGSSDAAFIASNILGWRSITAESGPETLLHQIVDDQMVEYFRAKPS